ncbi:MAG TPA: SEC-C metal-binding domain-containing protein [Casimicrobiaceae bacterium]
MEPQTGRNALCWCGSGKRYKHCHGALDAVASRSPSSAPAAVRAAPVRDEALAAHRAGSLGRAEELYRRALEANPADVDVLHMLGVVMLQRLRYREALDYLIDAAERTGWRVAAIRHNLGLVLAKLGLREANARLNALAELSQALDRQRAAVRDDVDPLVSIVVWEGDDSGPAPDPAARVTRSIASTVSQDYRRLELVVAGGASADAVSAVLATGGAGPALAFRVLAADRSGAARTLNRAIATSSGTFVALLRAGDVQAPERIGALVDAIARRRARWGFSLVAEADRDEAPDATFAARAADVTTRQRIALATPPASLAFVETNAATTPGNLFVERALFDELGGFRELPHHWDHDFCLRATWLAEPVVVRRPLYFSSAAVRDPRQSIGDDADATSAARVVSDFLAVAMSARDAVNPLAPGHPANRAALLKQVFRANLGALLPAKGLHAIALDARACKPGAAEAGAPGMGKRTAVVVLGMHRSGTSAVSRVLNLCGAYLPPEVKPAMLGVNAKGFWETEAILDLDSRVMQQLGGNWDRVDFVLPESGAVIDEFVVDAREVVANQYATAPTILIKDPRIGALAPLWQRVLSDMGFATAWVVPVRNPLEVARSLHARGDMGVREGLALWLAYIRRIGDFSRGRSDVIWFTYEELLADWRAVVARVAKKLGVALDPAAQPAEVDRFLDRDLRHHVADGDLLDTLSGEPLVDDVRAAYRECLLRCAADAHGDADGYGDADGCDDARETRAGQPAADVSFALCIENNGLREQALLLCESVRRFGGRQRNARIVAFAPRPGLDVDRETRAHLADLAVDYVDEPLNTTCPAYGPANRVFAGAWAEARLDSEWIAVLDSDTLVLGEIELPAGGDAAVRVVDAKGSATRGPDDPFEPYWERMAGIAGIALDRLPRVRTTITGEPIRASYNGGFTAVRRSVGILARCAQLFAASLEAGWRPYAGAGVEIHASTGAVGRDGSEFWGSSQTALALAIWASTDRVLHHSDRYNVPLHLIAAGGEIDPRWLVGPPIHVHYHAMFGARSHEIALELLARLGIATEVLHWLRTRLPFQAV